MSKYGHAKHAVIIGAGIGGVATAARLAKAGFRVSVYEKNDFSGGRCSLLHHDGYRFDQGPSLVLLPNLFKEAFNDLGTSLEKEDVTLLKCEPNYHVWFGDGERFELSTDLSRMKLEIEKWEGKDGFERFLDWQKEAHRHFEISVREVLHKNFTSLLSLLRPSFLPHLFDLHPLESLYSRAAKYFWTERLRRVFTFGSMYMGMSPFDAPGTYSLLQYTEISEGIWYPVGGFHKIVDALLKVGERFGVEYHFNSPISSINVSADGQSTQGVKLASGEDVQADVVICGADLVYSYNNLLPPSRYAHALEKRKGSCSSISFYWALDRQIPELKAHNIFLADEYRESFDRIFKDQSLPDQPSFYVNVPSRVDPSAAPPGKDTVVVLCPIGHLHSEAEGKGLAPQDWQALIQTARAAVINTVETRLNISLSSHIIYETMNTPQTWKDIFNLDKGAILGLSHSFFNVLSFRPRTKHNNISNLYFVGASTHPGTGVPIVLAGSKITSQQVCEDFHVDPTPERDTHATSPPIREIDKPHIRPILSWLHVVGLVLLSLGIVLAVSRLKKS
ncbi:MAG: hypothetical protein M1828_005597 [Chrysothrix sp. TS-e1954]|nr:MAG: hypothetical protein M1828_005597 [Chrysothrix sp. TS-e1954]